jgi:LysR family nod box-dependent transcriptional activator
VRALDRFNLNLFFALDAILNSVTLTEAARKSHLTQPAMSVSLKKLRGIFGDELVIYRSGEEARLTELALALRPRVRQILQASREVIDFTPAFDPATDEGTVRIAAPDVVELIILGPLFARISNAAPRMRVMSLPFEYEPVSTLFEMPLDIAIVGEAFASPDLAKVRLISETMSCMVWSGSRHAAGLTEAAFRNGRHVGISRPSGRTGGRPTPLFAHPVGQTLHRMSEDVDIVARASTYAAVPHAIIGTDLIATTLTSYAELCATMLPVVVLPAPIPTPTMNFVAQWQHYRESEPMLRWLLEQLQAVAALRPAAAALG